MFLTVFVFVAAFSAYTSSKSKSGLTKLITKEIYSWLTEDLNVFQDAGAGQGEATDVFGLSQVAVQAVGEVHHVVLGGVDLPEGGAQRAASLLKVGLLTAPLLL